MSLTASLLHQTHVYDPNSGILYRRLKHGILKPTGTLHSSGYLFAGIRYKVYKVHRIGWLMHYGEWPKNELDHIDGDRANNRISNLRDVSRLENTRNMAKPINNTSGVVGVNWDKVRGKWIAKIGHNDQTVYLGGFGTLEEAAQRRKDAERELGYHANHGRNPA